MIQLLKILFALIIFKAYDISICFQRDFLNDKFQIFEMLDLIILNVHICSFNYEDTVKAVEGSLGCNEPPKTVMTAEAADEYEKKLIEAAKQQSLQEMVKY